MSKKITGFEIKLRENMLPEDCKLIINHIKKLREVKKVKSIVVFERDIRPEFLGYNIVEIEKQISQREDMMSQMVGNLYSSILYDEIEELKKLKEKKLKNDKLKYDVISKDK